MDHPKRDPFVEIYLQLAEALEVLRDAREETEGSELEADPEAANSASEDPTAAG